MFNGHRAMAVYCGHQFGGNPNFKTEAEKLGKLMAENKIHLVYGAGNVGLMGAVASSVIYHGGHAVGISTHHVIAKQEPMLGGIDSEIKDSIMERKSRMIELADAFCIVPGGIGTLNELTDVMTMHQIGESTKPIYFLNTDGYWNMFGELLKQMVRDGFVRNQAEYNMHIMHNPEDIINAYNSRFF